MGVRYYYLGVSFLWMTILRLDLKEPFVSITVIYNIFFIFALFPHRLLQYLQEWHPVKIPSIH